MSDLIILRIRRSKLLWKGLDVEMLDDAGRRWPAEPDTYVDPSLLLLPSGVSVRYEKELGTELPRLTEDLREQTGPHATGPSSVPVFIDCPPRTDGEGIVRALLRAIHVADDAVQLVSLPRIEAPAAPLLELPIGIGWSSAAAEAVVTDLRRTSWVDDMVFASGLRFGVAPKDANILITDRSVKLGDAVRLLVNVGETPLRRRVSVPTIDVGSGPHEKRRKTLERLVHGIVHDYPLHEAVKSAERLTGVPLRLYSTPIQNQSLRLTGAFTKARDQLVPVLEYPYPALQPRPSPQQGRSVDIALQCRELRGSESLFMSKREKLRANGRYRVCVQIGRPFEESILVTPVPPIDLQLPPPSPGGHRLSVVLYPFDLVCESKCLQTLTLPVQGPSKLISFDVVAPKTNGAARMRVSLYYELPPGAAEGEAMRNHLVQSFLIRCEVASEEARAQDDVLTARLEISRRPRLDRLELLQPRLVSFGMNESAPHVHTFTTKSTGHSSSVSIAETKLQVAVEGVRKILLDSTASPGGIPIFPATADPGDPAIVTAFDQAIRELARKGFELYFAVCSPPPRATAEERKNHEAVLAEIRARHDETIQIVRYDIDYVFPWPMLYDFPLPDPGAPVCKGFQREIDGKPISCEECLRTCAHRQADGTFDVFCAWGFWGTRHRVEQVLHGAAAAVAEPVGPLRPGGVRLALGLGGERADRLQVELQAKLGSVLALLPPNEKLEDTLWSDAKRPALLALLGHHDHDAKEGHRITLPPGDRWLVQRVLMNRLLPGAVGEAEWTDPHTIVILAACGSGAVDLRELVTFVDIFARAAAAAVVGTETVIFEGLACELIESIVLPMVREGSELGTAVLEFRRKLLRRLNPLGFVVTPYGDAGTRLLREEETGHVA